MAGPAHDASTAAIDVQPGTELAGYRVERRIGEGGMGVVYLAEHLVLGRKAALKLLRPEFAASDAFRERFVRESRAAAALQHPNIVPVYDAGEAAGAPYIAMRYVAGTDLASVLAREGALIPDRALSIVGQVASALDAAHAGGLVHRDVKPANILIEAETAYLTDFGLIKRIASESAHTKAGHIVGTVHYMAPEQIAGRPVDSRADVYALGCMLFHTLAGTAPFERDSEVAVIYAHMQDPPTPLSELRPALPASLDGVLTRAMAKAPADRFGSCSELVAAARTALEREEGGVAIEKVAPRAVPEQGDEQWMATVVERRRPDGPRGGGVAADQRTAAPDGGDAGAVGAGTAAAGRPGAAADAGSAPVPRVLVGASDRATAAMVGVALAGEGLDVRHAGGAGALVEAAKEDPPDLVLLEWSLGDGDGAETCRALRDDPATAGMPIVIIASWTEGLDPETARAAGADDYVEKPFSPLQLHVKMRRMLGERPSPG